MAGAAHQCIPRCGDVASSARHFHADDFELSIVSKSRRKCLESFRNGVELRAALAADGNGDFFHLKKWRLPHSNGTWTGISLGIREPQDNSGVICSKC